MYLACVYNITTVKSHSKVNNLILMYLAVIGLDLLSAEQLPSQSQKLLHSVLTGLLMGTHDAGAELIWKKMNEGNAKSKICESDRKKSFSLRH